MNKTFLFITLLLPFLGYSQNYKVETLTGETYKSLSGAQLITENWDENTALALGLETSFKWYGKSFDFSAEDALIFYGLGLTEASEYEDSTSLSALGFFTFLKSRPEGSPLLFKMEGEVGDRIIKMEWVNAGLKNGDPDDFVNFQVWLFETDARVEIHIGPNTITGTNAFIGGASGPKIGLYRKNVKTNDNKVFKSWMLTGDPAHPSINTAGLQVSLNGVPDEGTVYIFNDADAAALPRLLVNNPIKVYPNPSKTLVHIELPGAKEIKGQLRVLDMQSRVISQFDIQNPQTLTLDISSWAAGVYSLHFEDVSGNVFTQKIVRLH